jgi:hypothetical protein
MMDCHDCIVAAVLIRNVASRNLLNPVQVKNASSALGTWNRKHGRSGQLESHCAIQTTLKTRIYLKPNKKVWSWYGALLHN